MTGALRARLLRFLRVPPEPHLPAGDPRSARVFRAGASYWRLKQARWALGQGGTLLGLAFATALLYWQPSSEAGRRGWQAVQEAGGQWLSAGLGTLRVVEAFVWLAWLLQLPVSYGLARLDYELRWYIVTDRAARLREGIVHLTEMTLTLANVQDIRIRQGPLQRLLGLADVELRTAGGGEAAPGAQGRAPGRNLHLARFRQVDNAETIRDLVRERMRQARGAGLGDPDDPGEATPQGEDALALAAQELARESAALREAAGRAGSRLIGW